MNPNESETKFSIQILKRDIKRFSDWFRMIRIGSDTDIRMNRNSSDWLGINFNPILSPGWIRTKVSIRNEPDQTEVGLIKTEFSIRINQTSNLFGLIWIAKSVQINLTSDSFGLIQIENLIWIHSDWSHRLNRIESYWLRTNLHHTRYKMFFGLVQAHILHILNSFPNVLHRLWFKNWKISLKNNWVLLNVSWFHKEFNWIKLSTQLCRIKSKMLNTIP